ncbi:hypothetical protein NLO72_07375 [Pseudomonas tremae]|uniref:hypothetical protein n=1 Tax=Pseudomonas tremae TaxID=200454 RepID=UPI001F2B08FD|nr:hypothetical protein [Pseudomonas tremae]MCF5805197.1 hypothetical protein [Pseudomonas tremae]MCF5811260.1 hypothetical protein [Pseudomonas tremae]MCQ2989059.1 hypothetical protein [Pseudomonas tremae]
MITEQQRLAIVEEVGKRAEADSKLFDQVRATQATALNAVASRVAALEQKISLLLERA